MGFMRKVDDYIIERLCRPVVQVAVNRSGADHTMVALEVLRAGIFGVLASMIAGTVAGVAKATLTQAAIFSTMTALLCGFYLFLYWCDRTYLRKHTGNEWAAHNRERLRVMRCTFLILLSIFWGSDIYHGLTSHHTTDLGDYLFDLSLTIYWSHEFFSVAGTPPPSATERELKLQEQAG